jgi:hypothetical protein
MSTQRIRILIMSALFGHGIGYTLGFWRPARSMPFLNVTNSAWRIIARIIWVIIAAGFIASSMGFYGLLVPTSWRHPPATIFAVFSLVGLILFGRSWPIFSFIGASSMNTAVPVPLLWLDWPPIRLFRR